MAFPRALLLSALLGSAAMVKTAPVARSASSCGDVDLGRWGSITFEGTPLSLGDDGDIVIGGGPLYFVSATCSYTPVDKYDSTNKGYIANANDSTKCLTVSSLEQSDATLSFKDCSFDSNGDITPKQSFAWDFDAEYGTAPAYFNGRNTNAVNSTQPPTYTLKAQNGRPDFDNKRGKLLVDYTPNLTSLPAPIQIPEQNRPVHAPAPPPTLTCSSYQVGTINFNNMTSSSNQYDGPLNSNWEAQKDVRDNFVFEHCDYSSVGLEDDDTTVYGRIRPRSDLEDNQFQCYSFGGVDKTPGNEPKDDPYIYGVQKSSCSYTSSNYPIEIAKLNKNDNTIGFVPFGNQSQPGVLAAYTLLDYIREYDVQEDTSDSNGIGFAYIDSNNPNATKYPPGKVTFNASS